MSGINGMKKKKHPRERKDEVIAFRVNSELVLLLDDEARRRGIDRSTLARNVLTEFLRPGSVML